MNEIYELKEMLMKELEEYGRKGELKDVGSLEIVDKLSHTIKNLCKIIEAAEDEEGYSGAGGGSYARGGQGGNRGGGRSNAMGGSYARGRGRNARRDSMGRYSSERGGNSRYDGGSSRYDGGMSYADGIEEMVESIRGMMNDLPENIQRDAQRFVQKLEQEM